MTSPLSFSVEAEHGPARAGRISTRHGEIETPAFMPVGTLGAVKGLGPLDLEELGASIMLANLYHLSLRPGIDTIADLGGLHRFVGWRRPLITDSGGYQVFSLSGFREIDEGGVSFRSVHDGSMMRLGPRSVVESQQRLGVDIAMVLDECPPWPVEHDVAKDALERTNRWAEQAAEVWARLADPAGGLFGIVQGSFYSDLREQALAELVEMDFAGYAIGGVSVGEAKGLGRDIVRQVAPNLPQEKPRYLMGLGTPPDIAYAVTQGIDLFDCVLPSRNARHGALFTSRGVLRIKNSRFRTDERPLDPDCACPTCRSVSRAFLHHLFRTGEYSGKVLATRHNVWYYLDFVGQLREALKSGCLDVKVAVLLRHYGGPEGSSQDRQADEQESD